MRFQVFRFPYAHSTARLTARVVLHDIERSFNVCGFDTPWKSNSGKRLDDAMVPWVLPKYRSVVRRLALLGELMRAIDRKNDPT